MNTDIRSWVGTIIAWAKNNYLDIDYYTDTHIGIHLPEGMLYINMTKPDSWRVNTLKTWSLEEDHIVIDEIADRQLRVRRGPLMKLNVVQYPDGTGDNKKLMDGSREIAKLMNNPLRSNFWDAIMEG